MCIHIPTQKQIPEDLKVKKYATIEQHGLMFLWMKGKVNSQEKLFYNFPWDEEEEDWEEIFLQFDANFNYRLLIDNLMDLSHLAYLHKSTIGIEAVAEHASQKTTREGERVKVTRKMLNIHQAPTHLNLTGYNGKVDRWQSVEFCPPGNFWVQTGTAVAEKGFQEARGNDLLLKRNSVHMVIPKSEYSTNYFYKTVHKADRVTKEMKKVFTEQMTNTFLEDMELLSEIAAGSRGNQSKIDVAEILKISRRHFNMLEVYYNPQICINHTKKHFSWYFKGFHGASKWRKLFMNASGISEVKSLLDKMEESFLSASN